MGPDPGRGKLNSKNDIFFCPRSLLRVWSRETGPAVPARVGSLIRHTRDKSGAYSRDFSRFLRRRPLSYTARRRWVCAESIKFRYGVRMAFTAERPCILSKMKNMNKRAKYFFQWGKTFLDVVAATAVLWGRDYWSCEMICSYLFADS